MGRGYCALIILSVVMSAVIGAGPAVHGQPTAPPPPAAAQPPRPTPIAPGSPAGVAQQPPPPPLSVAPQGAPPAQTGASQLPVNGQTAKPGMPPNAPPIAGTGKSYVGGDRIDEILSDFDYDPTNKRDPFAPYAPPAVVTRNTSPLGPFFPLQKYDLDDLKVMGVIWDVRSPKAMVKDPSGKSHIIKKDDKIGNRNGYVAQIREGEVIVVEVIEASGRVVYQTRVMKVQKLKAGIK